MEFVSFFNKKIAVSPKGMWCFPSLDLVLLCRIKFNCFNLCCKYLQRHCCYVPIAKQLEFLSLKKSCLTLILISFTCEYREEKSKSRKFSNFSSEIFGSLRTSSTVLLGALCQALGQWWQEKKSAKEAKSEREKNCRKEKNNRKKGRGTCKNLLKYLTTHFQQVCVSRKIVSRVKMSNLKMCRVWRFHKRSPCFIECSRETNVIDISVDIQWGIKKQCYKRAIHAPLHHFSTVSMRFSRNFSPSTFPPILEPVER